jgi:hypothetical protein
MYKNMKIRKYWKNKQNLTKILNIKYKKNKIKWKKSPLVFEFLVFQAQHFDLHMARGGEVPY